MPLSSTNENIVVWLQHYLAEVSRKCAGFLDKTGQQFCAFDIVAAHRGVLHMTVMVRRPHTSAHMISCALFTLCA